MKTTPRPPKYLTASAKKLWARLFEELDLDHASILLLDELCGQFDRASQARKLIAEKGLTVTDRFGQEKLNPACTVESSAIAAMGRIYRLLGCDQVATGPIGRPAGS